MTAQNTQSLPHASIASAATKGRRAAILRRPLRELSFKRLLVGGRIADTGRLPRYAAIFLLSAAAIWAPITGYLKTAPLRYSSSTSLILPGSGASASVNLDDIGQVSSFANSAFASNSISPTETYKRLIGADRILAKASASLGIHQRDLGEPRIELVDQTGLIRVQMTGPSPAEAQAHGDALLSAFFDELDALRADEQSAREGSGLGAMAEYQDSVQQTRAAISFLEAETGLISSEQFDNQVAAMDLLETDVQALATTLAQKSETVRSLEATLGLPARLAAATLKLFADSEYLAIVSDLSGNATSLDAAGSTYGAKHPKVTEARAVLDASRAAALTQMRRVTGLSTADLSNLDFAPEGARAELLSQLVRLEAERAGAEAQHAAASDRFDTERARLQALAPAAARLEDLQRDFSVAEAVFASAIARVQSTKADVYASYPLVQVLEDPSLPDAPSSPKRMVAIAAGIAATFMLLVGIAMGWMRAALIGRLLAKPENAGA